MTVLRQRIARHFTALFTGEAFAQLLSFAAASYLARVLGPSGYGMWTYALTLVTYGATLVEAGTDTWGIREVSANPAKAGDVVSTVLTLRACLAVGVVVALSAYVAVAEPAGPRRLAILLGVASIVAIALQTHWALRAIDQIIPVAVAAPFQRALFFVVVLIGVRDAHAVPWAVLWQGTSEVVVSVYLLVALRRASAVRLHSAPRAEVVRAARTAWPIGAARGLRGLMYALNVAALAHVRSNDTVGQYGVATRVLMALLAMSTLFGTAVAPGLARAALRGAAPASRAIHASLRGATALFLPVALGGAVVAPRLIRTLFGEDYASAAPLLRVLLATLVITALVDILRRGLHFVHRQHQDLQNMLASAVASIFLSVALIPWLGALGAAISLALSELILLALTFRAAMRAGLAPRVVHAMRIPTTAALAMTGAVFAIRDRSIALSVPVAGLVFLLALRLLRDTTLAGLSVLDVPDSSLAQEVDAAVANESPGDHLP